MHKPTFGLVSGRDTLSRFDAIEPEIVKRAPRFWLGPSKTNSVLDVRYDRTTRLRELKFLLGAIPELESDFTKWTTNKRHSSVQEIDKLKG